MSDIPPAACGGSFDKIWITNEGIVEGFTVQSTPDADLDRNPNGEQENIDTHQFDSIVDEQFWDALRTNSPQPNSGDGIVVADDHSYALNPTGNVGEQVIAADIEIPVEIPVEQVNFVAEEADAANMQSDESDSDEQRDNILPIGCDLCVERFHDNYELLNHKRKAHGAPKFRCPNCRLKFKATSSLYRHSIKEHGEHVSFKGNFPRKHKLEYRK